MPAWSDEIAATFVRLASEHCLTLDQMQVQGLVYVAHGWGLVTLGQPLTGDRPTISEFGPEYERIAWILRGVGIREVRSSDLPTFNTSDLDQEELDLISSILDTHGGLNASQLATITRDDASPWSQRVDTDVGREISHNEIRRQFEAYLDGKGNQAEAR